MPKDINIAENYKQYLNPLPEVFDVSDLTDDRILIETHLIIVKRYLCKSCDWGSASFVIRTNFSLETRSRYGRNREDI